MKTKTTSIKQKINKKGEGRLQNQKSTPNYKRVNPNITEEQKEMADRVKDDILSLHSEGFSVRTIANHYNDLYAHKNEKGEIVFDAISRETIRKIINKQEVSLKSVLKNEKIIANFT